MLFSAFYFCFFVYINIKINFVTNQKSGQYMEPAVKVCYPQSTFSLEI